MGKKIISICLILLYSMSTIGVAVYDCHCEHSHQLVMFSSVDCSCSHASHSHDSHTCNGCENHNHQNTKTDDICGLSADGCCKIVYESLSDDVEVETDFSWNSKLLASVILWSQVETVDIQPKHCFEANNTSSKEFLEPPIIYKNCQLRL